jgi:hypothetical protein
MKTDLGAEHLVGMIKTFGPAGPAYEVLERVRQLAGGDWLMKIQVLESGETLEYSTAEIAADPLPL